MGIALDFLGLLGLVILAVLEAIAAVLPVITIDGTAAVAPGTGLAAVAVVTATSSSTATTATTSTATTSAARPVVAAVVVAALAALVTVALPLGLDALLLALHLGVLPLAHGGELVVIELGRRVEGEELLLLVLGGEFDKHTSLESAILLTPLANHNCAVGAEELLQRNLACLCIAAKALDVGALAEVVGGCLPQAVEEIFGGRRVLLVIVPSGDGDGLLALDGLLAGAAVVAIVDDDEVLGFAQGVHDGAVGLEAAHALEVGDVLDADGAVLGAIELLEEVLVCDEVVSGEVEFDLEVVSIRRTAQSCLESYLVADLDRVVSFGKVLELVGARPG